MSFAFDRDDQTVEQGLRRIALEQIDKALLEASAPQAEFERTVHQLRRRCKNLRGLLRIVRRELKEYEAEDEAVSSMASQLSFARDATVIVETFDGLIQGAEDKDGLQPLRDILVERSRALELQADNQALLREACEALLAMRRRAGTWQIKPKGYRAIAVGIEETYRRMRRRMSEAETDGAPATLHAWRKQAKYHRHHVLLMRRHAPDVLDSRSKLLAELADLLGHHHDLAVLVEVLTGRLAGVLAPLTVIVELAERRQRQLAERAFALGRQIGAEKPAALSERLRQYWTLGES